MGQIFLSTPSARRATLPVPPVAGRSMYFYPRPPRGGRPHTHMILVSLVNFYPRPPRGGRPFPHRFVSHSLLFLSTPSARRATWVVPPIVVYVLLFLSTPSARRATSVTSNSQVEPADFYPRPPRGGRLIVHPSTRWCGEISIHALREEGDSKNRDKISIFKQIIQHSARI